jgi:hypothetical protein
LRFLRKDRIGRISSNELESISFYKCAWLLSGPFGDV